MGDSGSSRPVSPPPSGAPNAGDIMRSIFEGGDKTRQLNDAQRQQAVQDQGRQRQSLSDAVGGEHAHETGRGEESREGTQPEVRNRAPEGRRVVRESDSFLSRLSTQQAQRDAGKDLSRPQTLSSLSAQAWTVATSTHTPETARQLIQQRQDNTPPPPRAATGAGSGNSASTNSAGASATNRSLPIFTRPASPTPSTPTVVIRYASTPDRSSDSGAARTFAGRPMLLENFRSQIQRLVQDQLGRSAQQSLGDQGNVAVNVRGDIIFVRDGDKFRAFRLEKDGTLSELPSDDAGEHPLSADAQKLLEKVMRQKGLHSKLSGGGADNAGELSDAQLAELVEKQNAEEKSAEKGELDFETKFALLLHEVLEEGKSNAKEFEGDPAFPSKADWAAFFAKLSKMGNQEKSSSKTMDSILNMMFRGLFKKQDKGNVLVGDLQYMKSGKAKQEKFAQVALGDGQVMELLKLLQPGQKISKEMLAKAFGEELGYLMMAHTEEKAFNMASSSEKNVVFNPKSQVDLYGQARMEKTILASRKDKRPGELPANGGQGKSNGEAILAPTNPNELMNLREINKGRPRFYSFILYGVFASLTAILLFFLLMKLMNN